MTPQDFIDEFRRVTDDVLRDLNGNSTGLLWQDDEILRYLSDACDEACERALLVEDHGTAACCRVPLVAGQAEYLLHRSVIKVKRVALGSRVLHETSTVEQDNLHFGWESLTGAPCNFIQTSANTIRLIRTPRAEDVIAQPALALTVYRTLLAPITIDSQLDVELPDIKPIYQPRLLAWVFHKAYSKRDSETFDAARARDFEDQFIRAFGQRPDANVQRKRRDKRPPVVRMRF